MEASILIGTECTFINAPSYFDWISFHSFPYSLSSVIGMPSAGSPVVVSNTWHEIGSGFCAKPVDPDMRIITIGTMAAFRHMIRPLSL